MEPGHEDREYFDHRRGDEPRIHASMEPGHEDREYHGRSPLGGPLPHRLNGARS